MAISKPVPVPKKKITSLDVVGFSGGLFLNGAQNGDGNQFIESRDVELTPNGFLKPRKSLQKWLPETVEEGHEIFPALIDGQVYNFTADDGKIIYCQEGDSAWSDCGGANAITTQNGGKCTFVRTLDSILILNGGNGDKLAYVDLNTENYDVVKYDLVDDPTSAPSAAATGISNSGSYKIYYGYTYTSATGETKISPILQYTISKPRYNWDPQDGTEYLTVTRPGSAPAGAKYWNLYIALAANGGSIQESDMLMLAAGLDLNTNSIEDNGTLAIDIGRGNPPTVNNTDGPRCKYAIETNGRPVLFGDVDNPYSVHIGGDGEFARDFSSANGGFRSEPSKGTNYYPASVIGFRNGQGIPSLTIFFSNTQGLSKQATLEQQTINYGNQSFVVWGVTEQNYGAAGVAASYSMINYNGSLSFFSTDGPMTVDTQPQLQNVLATRRILEDLEPYTRRIKVSALDEVVGTGWENKLLWIVPANGFNTPNEILIRDLDNNGAGIRLKIPAQWIGTVSPPGTPAFVYIRQGTKILKLYESFGTVDYKGDGSTTFATGAKGTLLGFNEAKNVHQALVQAMFYFMDLIGPVTVGVNYRDQNGNIKTKQRVYNGPAYVKSSSGGWSDPHYLYTSSISKVPARWNTVAPINVAASSLNREDARIPLQVNDLASEVQWWYETPVGYSDYLYRGVSYEGENLGVKPDLR